MRRATAVAAVAVSMVAFAVGWVANSSDEQTTVSAPRLVAFEPLPVPEVIILNGPWADPLPKPVEPAKAVSFVKVDSIVEDIYRVLGLEPPPSRFKVGTN